METQKRYLAIFFALALHTGCNLPEELSLDTVPSPTPDLPSEPDFSLEEEQAQKGTPGTLDSSFGKEGIATLFSYASGNDLNAYGRAGAIQADGKILVAGTTSAATYIVRLLPNGMIDTTFRGGVVPLSTGLAAAGALDIAVQKDGKILLAATQRAASTTEFLVARFHDNGNLDHRFGDNGIFTSSYESKHAALYKVIPLDDGSILAGGYLWNENGTPSLSNDDHEDLAILKLDSNGQLDASFGIDGLVRMSLEAGSREVARDLAVQEDGKIISVGGKYKAGVHQFAMIRFHADGALDESFGVNGIVLHDSNSWVLEWNGVAIQKDGKIIAVGSKYHSGSGPSTLHIHRFQANGAIDAAFGSGGVVVPSFPTQSPTRDFGRAVALDSKGRIVVAGNSFRACASLYTGIDVAIVRLLEDGSVDPVFGNTLDCSGRPMSHVQAWYTGISQDYVTDMAIQPDGRIVIFGHTDTATGGVNGDHDFMVMRFWE